jgi:hypothetical protein
MKKLFHALVFAFTAFTLSGCNPYVEYQKSVEIRNLRSVVTASMKDPSSTQFRDETYSNGTLCGELNSKNGYGAYVGFKRFIVENKKEAFLDGTGFVGKEMSHDNVIISLDYRNEVLREIIDEAKAGKEKPSADAIENRVTLHSFNKLWKNLCVDKKPE